MYMLKVKKFHGTCMRLFIVKQNIEGDANLHHPPERGLSRSAYRKVLPFLKCNGRHLKNIPD